MPEYDPYTLTAAKREFIQAIKDENLILIPAEYGEVVFDVVKKQQSLLKHKAVSAYMVAKYKLIPNVNTLRTIKNMVADGRISASECYHDASGKLHIITNYIKRVRG